jgi:hypothetical protein
MDLILNDGEVMEWIPDRNVADIQAKFDEWTNLGEEDGLLTPWALILALPPPPPPPDEDDSDDSMLMDPSSDDDSSSAGSNA